MKALITLGITIVLSTILSIYLVDERPLFLFVAYPIGWVVILIGVNIKKR